jgi:hypothetical protein
MLIPKGLNDSTPASLARFGTMSSNTWGVMFLILIVSILPSFHNLPPGQNDLHAALQAWRGRKADAGDLRSPSSRGAGITEIIGQ